MLRVKNINFNYQSRKENNPVLSEINFELKTGQNLAIIGESGCGKSTLIKAIYGLIDLKKGEISFDGNQVLGPAFNLIPGYHEMKYLAQDFDLMPFVKVRENVGKFLSNFFLEEKAKKIEELLNLVDMNDYAETMTNQLSGGQKQRIALAQVLAQEPKLLLLDEPFSHIDQFRKNSLRRKLFHYLKEKNISCIVATHDMADVLPFSDEIIVLENGQILQKGFTNDVYLNPKNIEVAKLFGDAFQISKKLAINLKTLSKHILYPSQLKVNCENGIQAVITNKYNFGSYFLYQAKNEEDVIMFNAEEVYENGDKVFVTLKEF